MKGEGRGGEGKEKRTVATRERVLGTFIYFTWI